MGVRVPIVTEFDGGGISKAVKQFKQLETAGEKAQFAIKKAAVPAAAALGGLAVAGFQAAKAAMEDQKSSAELARQLKISTQATDAQVNATEDLISKMTLATGVADTDLRNAMATLARGMGSAELAQKNLNLALDISAATGKDLTTVSEALSKAYNGQTTALAKLDPSMRGLVKEGASFNEIGAIMADTFGGAAATAAGTAEGQFKRLGVAFGEAQESLGMALMPAIQAFLPLLQGAAEWAQKNTGTVKNLAIAVGVLSAAILAINIGMKVYTAATTLATAAQWAFNAAVSANPIVLIGAAIATAIALIYRFRTEIKAAFDDFDRFMNKFGFLGKIAGAAGKASIPGLRGIQGLANLFTKIPGMADGGVVTKPTLAVIGEAGPEAVVPLNKAGSMGNVTINVHGGDPQSVVDALRRYMLTSGPIPIKVAA